MATYVVNTRADVVDAGDGVLSLREALAQAQAHTGADTVTFDQAVFRPGNGTITLTQGQLAVTQRGGPLTIDGDLDGNHTADVTIDAGGHGRVLDLQGASPQESVEVTLEGLVLTGGGLPDRDIRLDGAGINAAYAHVTIVDSAVSHNQNTFFDPGWGENDARGGGIRLSSSTLTIRDSAISDNEAVYGHGGGIWARDSAIVLEGSVLAGNHAGSYNGAGGGGITVENCRLEIIGSALTGNRATGSYHFGPGRGGAVLASGSVVVVTDSDIADNRATGGWSDGGGIAISGGSLVVSSSSIADNTAAVGGGLSMNGGFGATATVTSSLITGNTASFSYGARGGGVFVNSDASLVLVESTVAHNTATVGDFVDRYEADGGGLAVNGHAIISDSTISGNTVQGDGGGLLLGYAAAVSITNSTVADNRVYVNALYGGDYSGSGGGIAATGSASLRLANTIVAGNSADDDPDLAGRTASDGHNLFSQGDVTGAAAGDIVVAAGDVFTRVLGPLAGNGGPTPTHALLPGSLAIDAGDTSDAVGPDGAPLTADQRGEPRVVGGGVDIGAVESGGGETEIAGTPGADTLPGTGGADVIRGLQGGDRLNGLTATDTLSGGAGDDSLFGGRGADFLLGDSGDDRLRGNIGADTLSGADGADTLVGGDGADRLRGGDGRDVFVFASDAGAGGADAVVDFHPGEDRIRLDDLVSDTAGLTDLLAASHGDALALAALGGRDVRLLGIDVHSLHMSDFLLT